MSVKSRLQDERVYGIISVHGPVLTRDIKLISDLSLWRVHSSLVRLRADDLIEGVPTSGSYMWRLKKKPKSDKEVPADGPKVERDPDNEEDRRLYMSHYCRYFGLW